MLIYLLNIYIIKKLRIILKIFKILLKFILTKKTETFFNLIENLHFIKLYMEAKNFFFFKIIIIIQNFSQNKNIKIKN